MPRLTEEQKAANKARSQAFSARKKAYYAALEAAKAAVDTWGSDEAVTALQKARNELNAQVSNIRDQIEALQAHLQNVEQAHRPHIAALIIARNTAWDKLREDVKKGVAAVNAQFPDMVGRYSAAGWKMPEESDG